VGKDTGGVRKKERMGWGHEMKYESKIRVSKEAEGWEGRGKGEGGVWGSGKSKRGRNKEGELCDVGRG